MSLGSSTTTTPPAPKPKKYAGYKVGTLDVSTVICLYIISVRRLKVSV